MATGTKQMKVKCPDCERSLAPLDQMQSAVQIVKRTCGGCRTQWQVKIVPHPVNARGIERYDVLEWVRLEKAVTA